MGFKGIYLTSLRATQILQKGGQTMFMINRVNAMTLLTAPSAFVRLREIG